MLKRFADNFYRLPAVVKAVALALLLVLYFGIAYAIPYGLHLAELWSGIPIPTFVFCLISAAIFIMLQWSLYSALTDDDEKARQWYFWTFFATMMVIALASYILSGNNLRVVPSGTMNFLSIVMLMLGHHIQHHISERRKTVAA